MQLQGSVRNVVTRLATVSSYNGSKAFQIVPSKADFSRGAERKNLRAASIPARESMVTQILRSPIQDRPLGLETVARNATMEDRQRAKAQSREGQLREAGQQTVDGVDARVVPGRWGGTGIETRNPYLVCMSYAPLLHGILPTALETHLRGQDRRFAVCRQVGSPPASLTHSFFRPSRLLEQE